MLEVAGQTSQTHHHAIFGEILPHFYVNNTFLAQKLTKLEHFKEFPDNFIFDSYHFYFNIYYYLQSLNNSINNTRFIPISSAFSEEGNSSFKLSTDQVGLRSCLLLSQVPYS